MIFIFDKIWKLHIQSEIFFVMMMTMTTTEATAAATADAKHNEETRKKNKKKTLRSIEYSNLINTSLSNSLANDLFLIFFFYFLRVGFYLFAFERILVCWYTQKKRPFSMKRSVCITFFLLSIFTLIKKYYSQSAEKVYPNG